MIVVGVDGSRGGERALMWAVDEASQRDTRVTAVRAWMGVSEVVAASDAAKSASREQRRLLDLHVGAVTSVIRHGKPIERVIVDGDPATALMEAAAARDAELLVVGRRGLGRVAGLLIGSVSRACASQAHRNVVVIPPTFDRQVVKRIVVGVEDSPESVEALRWAVDEAAYWKARIIVVHAFSPSTFVPTVEGYADANALTDRIIEKALADTALRPPLERLTLEGRPATELLGQATRADLLVVGAARTSAAALLGSVTSHCLERAPTPMTVVHGG